MLDFTFELAKAFNVLPFEIMKQDKDEVIMIINYLVEKAETETTKPIQSSDIKYEKNNSNIKRVRVNDKTATGGWF